MTGVQATPAQYGMWITEQGRRLPDPDLPTVSGGPPRTPAERMVAAVFADVLGLDEVGAEDNFFARGGHSLLAAKAAARLGGIPVRALFTHPTVAALATEIPRHRSTAAPSRRPAGTQPPLSPAQERLWFLQRLDPDDASYNMFIVRRLTGQLDVEAFRRACTALTARHESLRTGFPEVDGRATAVVQPRSPVSLEYIDVANEHEARARAAQRTNEPFDLTSAPVRFTLMRIRPKDHVLCVVLHHIVADSWSLNVILDDLSTLYSAGTLPPLRLQHGDVARWQQRQSTAIDYWRKQLADPPALALPRHEQSTGHGEFHEFRVPGTVISDLERVGRDHGATLFMVLLAAYQVLLSRHTGQTDITVGSPVAGRDLVELEPIVGYLSNTVVLRGDLTGNPAFAELLVRTRDTVLDAMAHQDVPFESLLSGHPLVETMAMLHTQAAGRTTLDDLRMDYFDAGYRQAKFDLMLEAWRDPDSLYAVLGYDTGLFDAHTIAQLADRFATLLTGIAQAPTARLSALPLLTTADQALLRSWGGTNKNLPATTVPELIADAIEVHSGEIAVICGDTAISYARLGERVSAMAASLRHDGVAAGSVVGVALGRSIDAVVALLAIWQAGAAYLPLDPELPAARTAYLVDDTAATLVITEGYVVKDSPHQTLRVNRDHPAYILYTSGSTGVPKGVVVEHGSLAARVRWMRDEYDLAPGDKIVQLASLSFDTHAEEIYPALAAGATVILLPDGGSSLPELMASQHDITVLDLPTAYFHTLLDTTWPRALRLVILGGEQLHASALANWRDRFGDNVRLVNTYGPTETTIVATAADLHREVHIGRPIDTTTVRVLDEYGQLVPPGAPGELAIGGAGVARGYLRRADLTAEKFVHGPGGRHYLTGDRVRWRPDGNLEFLGRIDNQVKIRGYRVEPGEIESHLVAQPGVEAAVVVARDATLIAYVVGACEPTCLADILPPHMIPTHWVNLPELPSTISGKVDRDALPEPEPARDSGYIAPRTDAEDLVAFVWGEVLGLEKISARDDFFALGGHSLVAVQVAARLRAIIEVDVPIRLLFTERTVERLAAGVERLLDPSGTLDPQHD